MKRIGIGFVLLMVLPWTSALAMNIPDIAFVRKSLDSPPGFDSNFDIYTMDINGDNLTRLTNNDYAELDPRFSPTDDLFSFYANPSGTLGGGIYRMNFDGTGVEELSGAGGGSEQNWSPDGSQLVFSKPAAIPGQTNLYTVNSDGSNETQITFDGGQHLMPQWSASGDRISFVSNTGTHIIDTNGLNQVSVASTSDYHAVWSPDG
ncbi:MAG: PD40 domain-containing protein, partial [Candidatus Omnitrophica bacterium]|nr:PD40 domain-containing protein [Candidatus Omnitrophota bacterium]